MSRRIALVAITALLFAAPGRLRADVMDVTELAFQAFSLDLLAASINDNVGMDLTATYNYSGTTDQNGWNGTIGGTYMGQSISGDLSATVSGDPTWTVGGNVNVTVGGGKPAMIQMAGSLVQSNANPMIFTTGAAGITVGAAAKGGYVFSGSLIETTNGDTTTFAGNVMSVDRVGGKLPWIASISINQKTKMITSSFFQGNKGVPLANGTQVTDKGMWTGMAPPMGNGFLDSMSDTATVPEPSSLALLAAGAIGAVIRFRRRPR